MREYPCKSLLFSVGYECTEIKIKRGLPLPCFEAMLYPIVIDRKVVKDITLKSNANKMILCGGAGQYYLVLNKIST